MSESACENTAVNVFNSGVYYTDGKPAPITITAVGPTGDHGGTLTDKSGNSPPVVPITVGSGDHYPFIAGSSAGSNGQFYGTITIQFAYGPSNGPWTYQTITVTYQGEPSRAINSKGCSVAASSGTSSNYVVKGTAQNCDSIGECTINFSASSSG